jgi:hypothetical protein
MINRAARDSSAAGSALADHELAGLVRDYNASDCRALGEILRWLRDTW